LAVPLAEQTVVHAQLERRRPQEHKLIANPRLRQLVQRKLNRCWSPDLKTGRARTACRDPYGILATWLSLLTASPTFG